MNRSSGPRKTSSNLSESVHQQLNMYAIPARRFATKFAIIVPTLVLLSLVSIAQTNEFTMAPLYAAPGAYSIATADFNGDGKADLAVVNGG